MDETSYLTAAQAAERLGISLRTVRRRIADGSLASVKLGRAVRVPASSLDMPPAGADSAIRETAVSYGTESDAEYIARWNRAHWPDSYERMLARRKRAFAELDRLRKLTKPPSGPHDTVDAMLREVREEFGARLLQFIPPAPGASE